MGGGGMGREQEYVPTGTTLPEMDSISSRILYSSRVSIGDRFSSRDFRKPLARSSSRELPMGRNIS